jgi:hypothetical protein
MSEWTDDPFFRDDLLSSGKGIRLYNKERRRLLELLRLRAEGKPIVLPPKNPFSRDKGDEL